MNLFFRIPVFLKNNLKFVFKRNKNGLKIIPVQVFITFFLILILLFSISMLFPKKGISISDKFVLHFFTVKDIFGSPGNEYADISGIIKQSEFLNDSILDLITDSAVIESSTAKFDTVRADADRLIQGIQKLQFPKGNKTILYPVFKALRNLSQTGSLIRIMHYGDSQIEADRMTSFYRNKLQNKFGGSGAGLMPADNFYKHTSSVIQTNSDNWYRYTLYGNVDTTIEHNRYGAMACFCRFSPYSTGEKKEDSIEYEAWASFEKSNYASRNTTQFRQCRIFYGYNSEPFINEVYIGEELYDADVLPPSNQMHTIKWRFDESQSAIKLKFTGKSSPEIYGIAMDNTWGVAVDNIPMRGSSGTIFTQIDKNLLKQMYKELNVKLIILQFGGNVVPHVTKSYKYYENWFYSQLKLLKDVVPGVSIIVIGVADMSIKDKDRFVSYPNIENVRDALKNATFKADMVYWDMYEAMGGKNSMPSWVFAEPPLASTDFVHFTPKGAKIISQMFYNSFLYEYNQYEINMKNLNIKIKENDD